MQLGFSHVYSKLCHDETISNSVSDLFANHGGEVELKIESKLCKSKFIVLDNPTKCTKLKRCLRNRGVKISKNVIKEIEYTSLQKLNSLWIQYFTSILEGPDSLNAVSKADLHGAGLKVAKSKNSSYIGEVGILARETKNAFHLISQDNSVKTIPKLGSVFSVLGLKINVFIFGNHFQSAAASRSSRKLKNKCTVEL